MTNILRRFAQSLELPKSGFSPKPEPVGPRPAPPPRMVSGGYQGLGGERPKTLPTAGGGASRAYGRLKHQLGCAQQRLVERDVEIAAMKVEMARLYEEVDALKSQLHERRA